MERMVEQELIFVESDRALARVNELRKELETLQERLNRLGKLETVLEGQSHKKRENLVDQLRQTVKFEEELKTIARGNKGGGKEARWVLKKQLRELERQKKLLREAVKEADKRGRALSHEIAVIRRKRGFLGQRLLNLKEILEITDEIQLSEKELEMLYERTSALKKPLVEDESNLREQIMDLVFRFHIPDRKKG